MFLSYFIDRLKHKSDTIKDPLFDNPYSYGSIQIDKEKCDKCGLCIDSCISKALKLEENELKVDNRKCIFCKKCISSCKNTALQMNNDCKLSSIDEAGEILKRKIYDKFKRSLVLRSVDTGSCNGCMLELSATQNTFYDLSRFGINVAASPRHSDGIIVTGPVTLNMKEALMKTYYAMPKPRFVIGLGSCACGGGIFQDCYATTEELDKILPVDLYMPGCPPSPQAIIHGLLKLMGRI